MTPQAAFGASIALSFVAWTTVAATFFWPRLAGRSRVDALRPLLAVHAFRFLGLSFFVPGVVAAGVPASFAREAAFGDAIAALLALLALALLTTKFATPVVWAFNLWGTADLLNAPLQGVLGGLQPGRLGAAYFIVTLIVPLLLVTHAMIFRILVQGDAARTRLREHRAA